MLPKFYPGSLQVDLEEQIGAAAQILHRTPDGQDLQIALCSKTLGGTGYTAEWALPLITWQFPHTGLRTCEGGRVLQWLLPQLVCGVHRLEELLLLFSFLHKVIYRLNQALIKIAMTVFTELVKNNHKMHMEVKIDSK